MSDEMTAEDWKQIAFFYQKKFNELEMNVLSLELALAKKEQSESVAPAADEDE